MYLIIDEEDGLNESDSTEENNGNKYLTFAFTDGNKEVLKKYIKLWDGIKAFIEKINNKSGEYEKDLIKIKFSSDDDLTLGRILKCHMLTVIVRPAFEDDGRYYPQVILDDCLHEL